jgi:fructose-1,6-bisphosphatase/inositol monophosphatase family enzyme
MGKADAFIDFRCSFEGQVAGAYILQKAGGNIRNYEDSDYDYKKAGIIATNGTLLVTKQ